MKCDLQALRRQLGDVAVESRLEKARQREAMLERVLAAVSAGTPFADAVKELVAGVRVATVRRWEKRWRCDGLGGLVDRRRGPPPEPTGQVDEPRQLSLTGVAAAAPDPASRRGDVAATARAARSSRGRVASRLVKWSGSKGAVVGVLAARVPTQYGNYHEPFVGGAALFFGLRPRGARLSDLNAELINMYIVVRDQPEDLIRALLPMQNNRDFYNEVRGILPQSLPPVDRAARTMYLNRTGFNGLYRVNRSGYFNVPYGNQSDTAFYQPQVIRGAHQVLQGTEISCEDFDGCAEHARQGDFVYFDPPYVAGLRGGKQFAYQPGGFPESEQRRLANLVRLLDQRGCFIMLSHSDCDLVRTLYAGLRFETLSVRRQIGGHPDRRGLTTEVLITNYQAVDRTLLPGLIV